MQIGAIFDWDGVIIDSSAHHEESWERLARELGKLLPDGHFEKGFGMRNAFIIPNLLKWAEDSEAVRAIALRKEELYREVVREWGIEPVPGVTELMSLLREDGHPAVIGSSTDRENITTALPILGLEDTFVDIVASEDVSRGKPDPEVFLLDASRLGMAPEHCIVFEDTQVGIQAAQSGGIQVIAVSTTHPREDLLDADVVVASLGDVDRALLLDVKQSNSKISQG